MRKVPFIDGQFYHIFNRGVDKRTIFEDNFDVARFFQSMEEFNVIEPIGSIYENFYRKNKDQNQLGNSIPKLVGSKGKDRLVNFVCYCLNPNHYHFILEQVTDKGIVKFMQKLGTGYTNYFNEKYKRSGSLFQGKFKAVHISSNPYLLHLSAYVNLNDEVHQLGSSTPKSSWKEYIGEEKRDFCKKDMTLGQFGSNKEYKVFAEETLEGILERRYAVENLEKLFLE